MVPKASLMLKATFDGKVAMEPNAAKDTYGLYGIELLPLSLNDTTIKTIVIISIWFCNRQVIVIGET